MSLKLTMQGVALLALTACGEGDPADLTGDLDGTASSVESLLASPNPNGVTGCRYFVGKGLKNFQAAGIIGNLMQESSMNPNAIQSGGPGRGIAQWSVGGRWDRSANDNVVWYANQQHKSAWSLQLQLDFTWYELTHFPSNSLAALRSSTNITAATIAFQNNFERCSDCRQAQRIAYARDVLGSCPARIASDPSMPADSLIDTDPAP